MGKDHCYNSLKDFIIISKKGEKWNEGKRNVQIIKHPRITTVEDGDW